MVPLLRQPLSRRTVLRGAAGSVIGLPLLEAMLPWRRAHAAANAAPKRFLVFYTPGGNVPDWSPTGSEAAFTLSRVLAPLEAFRKHMIFTNGIDYSVRDEPGNPGHPHTKGMGCMLTGQTLNQGNYKTC